MSPVDQRKEFIDAYLAKEASVSELCRRFEISRKTGYKWIARFMAGCELVDRSRRPKKSPRAVAEDLEDAIVDARKSRPTWGPRKLRAAFIRANPGAEVPSVSTFALIFHRNGLVTPRRRRRRLPRASTPLGHANAPNAVWCIDFKGDFAVGRGRCYPLTITDAYSRYLLACIALGGTRLTPVRRALERVFRTFGLPTAIRSDNGVPFASVHGPGGMSELSAWWLKLGIRHERIAPGKPQQNGRHERMHRTLKLDATLGCPTLHQQQRAFDKFRHDYNNVRPHEALGQRPPSEFYEPSPRRLPVPPWGRDFTYPSQYEVVRVSRTGRLPWNGRTVFASTVLRHQLLGLAWAEDGHWEVYFGKQLVGRLVGRGKSLSFTRIEDLKSTE
jgi:transposase InsO family protein